MRAVRCGGGSAFDTVFRYRRLSPAHVDNASIRMNVPIISIHSIVLSSSSRGQGGSNDVSMSSVVFSTYNP